MSEQYVPSVSMSGYVPDTETVREQYTREQPPHIGTVSEKAAEFDHWLAQHDREVKAAAWDEGRRVGYDDGRGGDAAYRKSNPYRIESGSQL